MDIVTLGAAQNYTNGHFKAGSNITFTENADGTVTMAASGEVSSEDTVARGAIADHEADKSNPHEVTASQVGLGNVNNTSDADKPISTATQAALDLKADATDIPTVNNATITIQKNGTKVDDFTVNASSNKTINITVPTSASDVSALPASTKYAGAATAGGSATSAAKLDTASAGSTTQPVYFANGVPTSTTYSLGKSVPSDAVFTDTKVGSGITLTGYTPESPSKTDTIVATDTVNAAIKKLDERSRADENNILLNRHYGVKNIFVPTTGTTTNPTGFTGTITRNADNSYTINGSTGGSVYYLMLGRINMPVGTFVLYARTGDKTGISVYNDGDWIDSGNDRYKTFSQPTSQNIFLRIAANQTLENYTIYPMICDRMAWDMSRDYEIGALSNAELTSGLASAVVKGTKYTANTAKTYTLKAGTAYLITVISYAVAGVFLALKYNNETSPRLFPVYKAASFDNSLTVASVADSSDISITPTSSSIWYISNIATL